MHPVVLLIYAFFMFVLSRGDQFYDRLIPNLRRQTSLWEQVSRKLSEEKSTKIPVSLPEVEAPPEYKTEPLTLGPACTVTLYEAQLGSIDSSNQFR